MHNINHECGTFSSSVFHQAQSLSKFLKVFNNVNCITMLIFDRPYSITFTYLIMKEYYIQ